MGIRAVTGYIAHVALVAYWAWVVASTAPQLRKGTRDRRVRARAFLLMATSQDPFDVWFRQVLLDTFGLDLTQPAGPPPEQILEWSADEPA